MDQTTRDTPHTGTPDNAAFIALKYERDREHELELNRITATRAHATLNIALILNGGAVTAFLTLYGAVADKTPLAPLPAIVAVLLWVAGLIVAAIAHGRAHKGQSGFASAYRFRRMAIEIAVLGTAKDSDAIVRRDAAGPQEAAAVARRRADKASRKMDQAWTLVGVALGLFAIGILAAAVSVLFAGDDGGLGGRLFKA